ncbi:MAG: hypothetical protein ABJ313_18725 [Cyclobacteriaceae bacterium]
MKQLLTLGTVVLSIGLTFGQTDQELAIDAAMNARTLNDIEHYQGKYEFQKQYWDQLNLGIVQTNWQLTKKKKPEQIGLTTISRNQEILHVEVYEWEYNRDWDGEDEREIFIYKTLNSKLNNDLDSMLNFDHLAKLPNQFTFGYACSASGSMPRKGEHMMSLVANKNLDELKSWLNSINPLLQAYAYLGFKLLEERGTELEQTTLKQMEQVANSPLSINYCSGCTVWEHRPVNELIGKKEIKRFLKWQN